MLGPAGGQDCQGHHGPFRDGASSSHLHILTKGFSNKHCKTKQSCIRGMFSAAFLKERSRRISLAA